MRFARPAAVAVALSFVGLSSCDEHRILAPDVGFEATTARASITAPIVISQIYGGGGNSGATYRNDFVELFNPGAGTVSIAGWSVQYQSSAGTAAWQATALTGSIPAGGYYLVQLASNNVTVGLPLPTPDATGSTNMAAGTGKVALLNSSAPMTGSCPVSSNLIDWVNFGGPTASCSLPTTGTGSATLSVSRKDQGCANTGNVAADFATGTPAPRNSATAPHLCPPPGASVTITPLLGPMFVGATRQFTAVEQDGLGNPVSTTFTWTGNASVSVTATGLATATSAGQGSVIATAADGVSATLTFRVINPPVPSTSDLIISQVFGGGGNSGAVLTNDFIEIYNRSNNAVDVSGWSVQYISATGNGTWSVTPLTGVVPPHAYYLVQEAAGNGGTQPLPTPDVVGSIGMGGSAGKVILASQTAALTGACPGGSTIADRVGYGTGAGDDGCSLEWGGRTDDVSVLTSAARVDGGCMSTGLGAFDFAVVPVAPRNSAVTSTCAAPSSATIIVNEILAEPFHAVGGASWGEWFEVRNTGGAPVDMIGWTITTQGQPSHTITTSLVVPPGGFKVLGRGGDPLQNGGITIDYNYFVGGGSSTIFLDPKDFILLKDAAGGVVDYARWTANNAFVIGSSRGVKNAALDNMDVGGTNWGYSSVQFGDGDFGTPGADNGTLADSPSAFPNTISFTGRFPGDAPLPVGFEDQLFATENLGTGGTLPTTFTWAAVTPALASIDANGVIHAIAAGSATFRATAADNTTGTITLPMSVPTLSTTANYANNAEFGEPIDLASHESFVIHRFTYTTSYNRTLGHPNWVSYDLDASHMGGEDRCDCFTHDDSLPASFPVIKTSDYTGAGAAAGFGIDRGHMARSFDRTTGSLDNATTYYFSNIIPQANKLNTQQWAAMETFLGDKARFENKEVYIITGPAGTRGSVKGEGKINIPAWVWKVAVIMPRDRGLADVHNYADLEVIAVAVPNDSTSTLPWQTNYVVTVDSVEHLAGYDLLSALPDDIETIIESGIKPPIAAVNGPFTSAEGSSVTMSGAGSFDTNGPVAGYAWDFGDGTTGTGVSVSHVYAQDGSYNVTLVVTDNDGLTDQVTTTASVANVAPTVSALAGAALLPHETWSASGTFSDPGADALSATVDYGEGSGAQALSLGAGTFALSHTYHVAGTYTVTLAVSDDDVTTTQTATVVVSTQAAGLQNIIAMVDQLAAGGAISAGNANSLEAKLDAAMKKAQQGQNAVAINQLNALLNEIDAMLRSGRLSPADAAALTAAVNRVITSLH